MDFVDFKVLSSVCARLIFDWCYIVARQSITHTHVGGALLDSPDVHELVVTELLDPVAVVDDPAERQPRRATRDLELALMVQVMVANT